ncbi:MAG: 4a-hydroxytetrahydrobiopterin dehydratase [Candidatus Omnitrophica bacterium]|nr:4a-hydroxytetrahydrobiopterin dehydratase [Candidatus Omnitrophota bacterium]
MEQLKNLKCEVCKAGAPVVTKEKVNALKLSIPEWEIIEEDNINKLTRRFKFKDFKEALTFVNDIGNIAEKEGHHPVMVVEYNHVIVSWWSHKIKGLHRNDFIMAAKTDSIKGREQV